MKIFYKLKGTPCPCPAGLWPIRVEQTLLRYWVRVIFQLTAGLNEEVFTHGASVDHTREKSHSRKCRKIIAGQFL